MDKPTSVIDGLPEGYKPGLEGVIAGVSTISEVDADRDALTYRGYPAHELAEKSSFEEVAYLLLHNALPGKAQLDGFAAELSKERAVSARLLDILSAMPKTANGMVSLATAVLLLQMEDPAADRNDGDSNLAKAKRLVAKAPTLVAALHRIRTGQAPIPPDPKLAHAANFLFMMTGKTPDAEVARIFDASMILYAEHGFNASTFAGMVTASTLSDMHSAVASAIGALKGPLHGGANEAAIQMILEIGDPEKVEPWLKEKLARKEKIMGFGHRVYKKQDSRAPLEKKLAEKMAARAGDKKLMAISVRLEDAMMREKKLFPNVDYHGAVVYYLMGLPIDVYTPIFAMSRMAGWTAHIIEQHAANRLIRPKGFYNGARGLTYVPVDAR